MVRAAGNRNHPCVHARGSSQRARLLGADLRHGSDLLFADGNEYWQGRGFSLGTGRSSFGVRLVCATSTCDSNGSTRARAYLRDITLTLRDSSKPTPRLTGELMDPTPSTGGWHRGNRVSPMTPATGVAASLPTA